MTMSVHVSDRDEETQCDRSPRRLRCACSASILRLLGASACVAGAVISWVAMAELLQSLNDNYKKPYFISYWVHSSYAVLYCMWQYWRVVPCNKRGDGALTNSRRLFLVSGVLAVLLNTSGYTWYLSLRFTNIPANTAINMSAAVFVFALSVPILRERPTVLKVVSVLLSVSGVALVAVYSTHSSCTTKPSDVVNHTTSFILRAPHASSCVEKSTWYGYVMLMVNVLSYAVFEVVYKKFATAKDDPAAVYNGLRVLGYIGVHTLLWLWPLIIVLNYFPYEPFHEPFQWPTRSMLGSMVLNAFLDNVFNGSVLVCIALSSPLFVSVGIILAIPGSVLVDWAVKGFLLPALAFVGIALIIVGFVGFTFSEFVAARREARHEKTERRRKLQQPVQSGDSPESEKLPLVEEVKVKHRHFFKQTLYKYIL